MLYNYLSRNNYVPEQTVYANELPRKQVLYTTITLYDGFENVNCCHRYPYLDIGAKVGAEINRHNC